MSGKREERRWQREALLDGYQRLVELSFDRSFMAVQGMRIRADLQAGDLEEVRRTEAKRHAEFDGILTRIRLLAVPDVVDAAVDMHLRDNALTDLAFASHHLAAESDLASFERERELNRKAKQKLLRAARASLGLKGVTPIDERTWGVTSTA